MTIDPNQLTPTGRLEALRDALRGALPAGFAWDYSRVREPKDCGTCGCAIGLASLLFGVDDGLCDGGRFFDSATWAAFFGLTLQRCHQIFADADLYVDVPRMVDVTPEHVAVLIDRHLCGDLPDGMFD